MPNARLAAERSAYEPVSALLESMTYEGVLRRVGYIAQKQLFVGNEICRSCPFGCNDLQALRRKDCGQFVLRGTPPLTSHHGTRHRRPLFDLTPARLRQAHFSLSDDGGGLNGQRNTCSNDAKGFRRLRIVRER
jgi:hypothetical protein